MTTITPVAIKNDTCDFATVGTDRGEDRRLGPGSLSMRQQNSIDASRVAAIVLHWGELSSSEAAIASLLDQEMERVDVFVVDHVGDYPEPVGLRDATGAAEDQPSVAKVLRPSSNLGFSGGVNLALGEIAARAYEYVLLFNNDAVAAANLVTTLASALDLDQQAAAAGPTVLRSDEEARIWYGGGRYSPRRGSVKHLFVGLDYAAMLKRYDDSIQSVTFVTGCALMLRAATIQELGPLDDRFFVYWEDAEWCARALTSGWRLLYVPLGVAYHAVSQSIGVNSPVYLYYILRNQLLFINLHTPRRWRPVAYLSPAYVVARELVLMGRRERTERRTALSTMVRAFRDALGGRYGPLAN